MLQKHVYEEQYYKNEIKGGKQESEKSIEVKLICHIARNGSFLAGLFRPIRREFLCSFSDQPYVS